MGFEEISHEIHVTRNKGERGVLISLALTTLLTSQNLKSLIVFFLSIFEKSYSLVSFCNAVIV